MAAQQQQALAPAGLLSTSFQAGSITGIRIRVHPLLPITTLIYAASRFLSFGPVGFGLGLLVFGPLLWASVLFHELWHCWAAKRLGIRVEEILLWPLGGLAFIGQSPTPCADMAVAAAGPASHVPQVLLWLGLLAAANGGSLAYLDADPRSSFTGAVCFDALALNAGARGPRDFRRIAEPRPLTQVTGEARPRRPAPQAWPSSTSACRATRSTAAGSSRTRSSRAGYRPSAPRRSSCAPPRSSSSASWRTGSG